MGIISGTSTKWLFVNCIQVELEYGIVGVLKREENRSTRRKIFLSKDENQQQTQPTCDADYENRIQATLFGGECSRHGAMAAPLEYIT